MLNKWNQVKSITVWAKTRCIFILSQIFLSDRQEDSSRHLQNSKRSHLKWIIKTQRNIELWFLKMSDDRKHFYKLLRQTDKMVQVFIPTGSLLLFFSSGFSAPWGRSRIWNTAFSEHTYELTAYIFLQGSLVFLNELLHLLRKAIPLVLQLFVQSEPVLILFSLQLVFQSQQLLLMLPPHTLVAQYLLS